MTTQPSLKTFFFFFLFPALDQPQPILPPPSSLARCYRYLFSNAGAQCAQPRNRATLHRQPHLGTSPRHPRRRPAAEPSRVGLSRAAHARMARLSPQQAQKWHALVRARRGSYPRERAADDGLDPRSVGNRYAGLGLGLGEENTAMRWARCSRGLGGPGSKCSYRYAHTVK